MLVALLISVRDWILIANFALSAYIVAVQPILRKPVVAVAKTITHPIRHPVKDLKKIVRIKQ